LTTDDIGYLTVMWWSHENR